MPSSGYSGTPLAQKLSLKDGLTVWFSDMPDSVRAKIGALDLIECAAKEGSLLSR